MDTITAFFLLLGITCGIIGTYLILTIIREIIVKWTPELLKINKQFIQPVNQLKEISSSFKLTGDEIKDKKLASVLKEQLKNATDDFNDIIKKYKTELDKSKKDQQRKFIIRRTWQAGSFLMGGFVFDFLAVISELFANLE